MMGEKRSSKTLQVLYRGPLESCNYGCAYCPFAKRRDSPQSIRRDRDALQRFVAWAEQGSVATGRVQRLEILFTPWGEALHRARYGKALRKLAELSHVNFVGAQTNLSVVPRWAADMSADTRAKLNMWATWHPTETTMRAFVDRVAQTESLGVHVSPGVVATKDHLPMIETLVDALLKVGSQLRWINAYKNGYRTPANYYSPNELAMLTELDPWFTRDLQGQRSGGKPCMTGTSAVSIDGDGQVTRCHFTSRVLGNIYRDSVEQILTEPETPLNCPRATCTCFQGYVHIPNTDLHDAFLGAARLSRRLPANVGSST